MICDVCENKHGKRRCLFRLALIPDSDNDCGDFDPRGAIRQCLPQSYYGLLEAHFSGYRGASRATIEDRIMEERK